MSSDRWQLSCFLDAVLMASSKGTWLRTIVGELIPNQPVGIIEPINSPGSALSGIHSESGQKHDTDKNGSLDKGTKITCQGLECHEIKITARKFEIGNFSFVDCGVISEADTKS